MIAKKLKKLKPYIFAQLKREKAELEEKAGRKVLDLSAGIPKYPPSTAYVEMLQKIVKEKSAYLYPSYKPEKELERAILNWYKKRFGVDKDLAVQIGHGAKDILTHLVPAVADREDEILLPDPGYPGFSSSFLFFEVKKKTYILPEKKGFRLDVNKIKRKINSRVRAIILNFPSNPTGQVADLNELQKIVDFCLERKILLIYDNAYSEIYFEDFVPPSILQCKNAEKIAVEIGSFSKSFSFAGLRLGWIIGNPDVVNAFGKVKSLFDTGVPIAFQKIAAFALENFDKDWWGKMKRHYKRQMERVGSLLEDLGCKFSYPRAGLYIWAKIPGDFEDSFDFVRWALKEKFLLFAPGEAFGKTGKKYIRAAFCAL